MAYLYYPVDIPPPLIDHPHERTHQHKTYFQSLFHLHPRPEENPNRPDVDIRDNFTEYWVDVEVPGVKDAHELKVQLVTSHMLVVSGDVNRPNEAAGESDAAPKDKPHAPIFLVGERRVGCFRRVINFPTEVDLIDGVDARLEAGLLRLKVQKKHAHTLEHKAKVEVKAPK